MKNFYLYIGIISLIIIGYVIYVMTRPMKCRAEQSNAITAITNVKIFDGEKMLGENVVIINGAQIESIGGTIPSGASVIDGQGATLIPGLIDSHTHTDIDGLRDALKFGITTELELQGRWSKSQRREISKCADIADLRSSGMGITPKGGHPSQYLKDYNFFIRILFGFFMSSVETPDEAREFVLQQIKNGADYIKVFIEDGENIGYPGLPVLGDDAIRAAIDEAHKHNKIVLVHATTAAGAEQAIDAGADGLAHLFFDKTDDKKLTQKIAAANAFVIPTLVTLSTAFGNDAAWLANDPRVSAKLSAKWLESLSRSMNVYPNGKIEEAYIAIKDLRNAGVDILAGSDVSEPMPMLGGLAHGASLHHELQLLVAAGFAPLDALRASTSVPARRFGLTDRGRIAPGMIADLVLIDGDPLTDISNTLSIKYVWHRGVRQ